MGKFGRIAAALLATFTPASLVAIAAPASAGVVSPTNVGNTGTGTRGYIDTQISAGSGGFAYVRSTPAGRQPVWTGFTAGGPVTLSSLPDTDNAVGVQSGLVVLTDYNGNVAWDYLNDGTGASAGSGPLIPSSNTAWTEDPTFAVSTAPGGWATVGDSTSTSAVDLLEVSTSGTVTDLGALPSPDGYSLVAGPDGVAYQTYDTSTGTRSAWVYVPYALPHTPVTLASDTSADYCSLVLSSDAICSYYDGATSSWSDIRVPLDGSADTSIPLPSGALFGTGTSQDAAWINADRSVSYVPWSGGTTTTVSSGGGLPARDLASDGTNLFISGGNGLSTDGIGEVSPSTSSTVTTLQSEPNAPVEAGGLAVTPGRVAWTDDAPPASTLSSGAGPLWDRTLTNSSGTLTAGTSANLVVTDASAYGLSLPAQLSISGRRSLYIDAANNLVVQDPSASTSETTLGATSVSPATVSGSRVLWFDNTAGKWKLHDLNKGTDADLSATIGNYDSASLWGDYIAFQKWSDGSVWRWNISNLSNTPVMVLASPDTATVFCHADSGPFVAGDYVAWSGDCFDNSTFNDTVLSGYDNVTAGSAAVDLSSDGYVVALSGSYVATAPIPPEPQNAAAVTVTRLGTPTATSPGTASGPVALDGSTMAWIDGSGDVQAESLPYVTEQPRYLGNGVASSTLALPGTWNGEWDASGALSICSVAITQNSTPVATLPCDSTDMTLGEAVVSWNGQDSGGSQVATGSYTWTLTASGLVGPDGSSLTLTGSINVSTPLTITTASLPNAVVNSPYSASIAATGGTSPYTFSLASGSNPLPAGLSLNATTGAITGTPTTAGSTSVTFQVTDSATPTPATTTEALSIAVNPPVSISTTSLPVATQNSPYNNASIAATGGTTPYTFSLATSSNPLPAGLSLDSSTGAITGTPTTVGSTSVTFQVTDSTTPTPGTNSQALTITVNPPPPDSPTGVTATAGVDSATITWTAPASGPTPTSYIVMWGNPTNSVNSSSTSATATGLTAGVSYAFSVEAVDAGGTSPPDGPSNAVVPTSVAAQNTQTQTGSDPTATTATSSSSGTVSVTADATGTGTVSVSTYSSDPVAGFEAGATYFDVSTTSDSTFSSLSFTVCGLASGEKVSWWNPTVQAWEPVSDATAVNSSGCSTVTVNSSTSPDLSQLNGTIFAVGLPSQGYSLVGSDGGVFALGGASYFGSEAGKALNAPIVGIAPTPDGGGYWLVASDGGVFTFGDAKFYGSKGGQHLNAPIVGMASTSSGDGYWLVASDGGVFTFGDAQFFGSMGSKPLNKPVVGMSVDPKTGGYWLVASDGGVFNFNAPFYGSKGGTTLNKPVVGMAADPNSGGYWLFAADGGVFNFVAPFSGSMGGQQLNKPVVGGSAG